MTQLRLIYATLLFCTIGCSVGPDYIRPALELPAEYSLEPESPTGAARAELIRWWTSLKDDNLTDLIQRAFKQNLHIAQALARLEQSEAALDAARSPFFPLLSLGLDGRRRATSSGQISSSLSGTTTTSQNNLDLGVRLEWELDLFGRIRRSEEAAEAARDVSLMDLHDFEVIVAADVARQYFTYRTLNARIEITKRNLEAQQRSAAISERRQAVGFADQYDVATAVAEYNLTNSQIPALESLAKQQLYGLSVLLGLPPNSLTSELEGASGVEIQFPDIDLGLPLALLQQRPDVRRAEAELREATARIGVAIGNLYPRLSLGAFFGFQDPELRGLADWDNHLWNIAASIAQPIFQGGRLVANLDAARASAAEALANYKKSALNALREVESALVAYQKERERLDKLANAVRASRLALEQAERLYSEGVGEYLNVLTAQRTLLSSEDSAAQSRQNTMLNLIALYKALGGGWDYSTGDRANQVNPPVGFTAFRIQAKS